MSDLESMMSKVSEQVNDTLKDSEKGIIRVPLECKMKEGLQPEQKVVKLVEEQPEQQSVQQKLVRKSDKNPNRRPVVEKPKDERSPHGHATRFAEKVAQKSKEKSLEKCADKSEEKSGKKFAQNLKISPVENQVSGKLSEVHSAPVWTVAEVESVQNAPIPENELVVQIEVIPENEVIVEMEKETPAQNHEISKNVPTSAKTHVAQNQVISPQDNETSDSDDLSDNEEQQKKSTLTVEDLTNQLTKAQQTLDKIMMPPPPPPSGMPILCALLNSSPILENVDLAKPCSSSHAPKLQRADVDVHMPVKRKAAKHDDECHYTVWVNNRANLQTNEEIRVQLVEHFIQPKRCRKNPAVLAEAHTRCNLAMAHGGPIMEYLTSQRKYYETFKQVHEEMCDCNRRRRK